MLTRKEQRNRFTRDAAAVSKPKMLSSANPLPCKAKFYMQSLTDEDVTDITHCSTNIFTGWCVICKLDPLFSRHL